MTPSRSRSTTASSPCCTNRGANPFFGGHVAHGCLVLAFAAGLFVDPAPGPSLANYGLDDLRFLEPVAPFDDIRVRRTVMEKRPERRPDYGEVRWDVEVFSGDATVARYELLTLSARAVSARFPGHRPAFS